MTVTALLVSHDGARWLPAALEGLAAQTHHPDRVLAVDTGSVDATPELLAKALGADRVLDAPPRTSFPDAVNLALQEIPHAEDTEWVWLLHDDSRPAPAALQRLLEVAATNPSVAVLGTKLREWPSLRRLLEVGVTMSGTGRRETGLERGEYDQGQHDRVRDVLAVSSAGMLIRRDVLEELGGFDRNLPIFGNDLDLGWRAARAGHRTMVVPDAVLFHVEAAHRGVRRTPVTGNHRRGERRAALYTLLVNSAPAAVPFLIIRLLLGSLLRALGLLLVRAPGEALDELVAMFQAYARPDRVLRGRMARRRTAKVPPREIRHLRAPFWVPYRHGLDFVSDLAIAVVHQASDTTSARRASRVAAETGPVAPEAQDLEADTGLLARLLTSPAPVFFAVLVVLALVGARGLLGSGMLSGGALLPAPETVTHWWGLYMESWHSNGVGSAAPAAPYLAPLALLGTMLVGKSWLVVDVLFLLAVPLAALGAWRFLRLVVGDGWPRLWGAVAYGLVPVASGAVAQGRLGTVAAAALLPWVAHAAFFLGPDSPADRRWRAAWRTGLLLAVLTAFVPIAWPLAVVLAASAVVGGIVCDGSRWAAGTWGPVGLAVAVVPVLVLPWSLLAFVDPGASTWYVDAGLAAPELVGDLGAWELLGGRATTAELGAAPVWFGLGLTLAAVAALVRQNTRRVVLACWVVILAGLAGAVALDAMGLWAGFPILVASGAATTAVAVAGTGIIGQLAGRSFGWRQPVGLVVVAAALLAPIAGLVWWATGGVTGPLDRAPASRIPTYMTDAALRDPDHGVLLLTRTPAGLGHSLQRSDGMRIGDDSVIAGEEDQAGLTTLVEDLATAPSAETVTELSHYGVEFIYLPPSADRALAGNLDSVSGLSSASAVQPGSRAWQLDAEPDRAALQSQSGSLRPVLLVLQGLALVTALVLAAPSRRAGR